MEDWPTVIAAHVSGLLKEMCDFIAEREAAAAAAGGSEARRDAPR